MYRHLFVTQDYPPRRGGVARYYENLLKEFPRESVLVVAPEADEEGAAQPQPVVRAPFFTSGFAWPRWLPLLHVLRSLLLQHRPAYIHVGQVLPVGTAVLFANRTLCIPTIVYTHGMDLLFAQRRPWRRWLAGLILRRAHTVVANSAFTASLVKKFGVAIDRIAVVQPGVSFWPPTRAPELEERLRTDLGIHEGVMMLLSVSRLVARKGIAAVLDAVAALPDTAQIMYCIAGEGPERPHLQQRAQTLGIHSRVRFLGGVDDATLRAFYAIADIFVLATEPAVGGDDVEGFGIVYLEANAYGKPVVGTDVGGVAEAVVDGVTGILIPPKNQQALKDALLLLMHDPALRARLGGSGKHRVETEGRWSQRVMPLFARIKEAQ